MTRWLEVFWQSVMATAAETAPDARQLGLRGRTYAIPFEEVWQAALRLAGGELRGCVLLDADDIEGVLNAERHRLWRSPILFTVRIGLDRDAQTRVDLRAWKDGSGPDLGASRRTIRRYTKALDRELGRARRRAPTIPSLPGQ